jgi:hypothetical protein
VTPGNNNYDDLATLVRSTPFVLEEYLSHSGIVATTGDLAQSTALNVL